jgi:uncharacterized protein (DUF2345 family)
MRRILITFSLVVLTVVVAYGQGIVEFLNLEATKKASLKSKVINIEADDAILLKTGSATISMKKDGTITISGTNIIITGTGNINVKASGNLQMKGNKILDN